MVVGRHRWQPARLRAGAAARQQLWLVWSPRWASRARQPRCCAGRVCARPSARSWYFRFRVQTLYCPEVLLCANYVMGWPCWAALVHFQSRRTGQTSKAAMHVPAITGWLMQPELGAQTQQHLLVTSLGGCSGLPAGAPRLPALEDPHQYLHSYYGAGCERGGGSGACTARARGCAASR